MKRSWTEDELLEHFTLVNVERKLIGNKTGASRLGFTVLLKYFQHDARFPTKKSDIPRTVVEYIAKQLKLSPVLFDEYRWGAEEGITPTTESKFEPSLVFKNSPVQIMNVWKNGYKNRFHLHTIQTI